MRRRFVDSGAIIGEVSGGESAGSPGIKAGAGGGGGQCDLRGGGGVNTSYVPTSAPPRGGGGVSVTYIPEGGGQGAGQNGGIWNANTGETQWTRLGVTYSAKEFAARQRALSQNQKLDRIIALLESILAATHR